MISHSGYEPNPITPTMAVGILIGAGLVGYLLLRPKKASAAEDSGTDTDPPAGSTTINVPVITQTPTTPTSLPSLSPELKPKFDSSAYLPCEWTYAELGKFAVANGYNIYYVDTPFAVSTWKPPHAAYLSNPNALAFAEADCSFYKWSFGVWAPDIETNNEFKMWRAFTALSRKGVQGVPGGK